MTAPKWFVESEYCANKVFQMNSMEYGTRADWDVDSFKAKLAEFEVTPYQHFVETGNTENVSPNALFNVPEYLAAMAAHMNSYVNEDGSIGYEGKVDWNEAGAAAELAEHGLSAWDHYTRTGMFEGLNPSNAFDTDAYCRAVADNMNAIPYEGRTGWTLEEAKAEMQKFGFNPVQHFLVQGGPVEGLSKSEVPAEEQVTTTYNPYAEGSGEGEGGIPGETFPLTPEVDVYPGTANDDLITGVVSGTAAENTLNNEDQIDGAGGVNTLEVAMNDDFRGFKGDGYMKNVQNVVLTAAEGEEVEFSAKGVEGVTAYTLNGNVSLADVADTAAAVTINGATEDIGLDFSEVSGTEDALTLSLNAVGVAATEEDEAVYVAVEAGGFESVNLTATGANIVDLSGIGAAKSFTITGDGSLDVAAVGGAVTAIDAQGLAGGIMVDASAAGIEAFTGGAGDDELTVDAGKVAAKAVIAGGEGEDTVVLNSSDAAATKYTMDSVENFTLGKIEGDLTMDASGMSGLSAVTVSKDVAAAVTVAKLGDADLTVNLEGAEGGATLLVDNEGSTVVNVTGKDATGLTFSNSESVQISVAEKMSYTGATVSANKATDIVIDAQGAINTTIAAAAATVVTFENVLENSTLTLDAAKVEELEGTLGADLTLSGTLSALTSIDFALQDGAAFTYSTAAEKLESLTLTGDGAATLGTVGAAGLEEFAAEVSGLDSFVLGPVTAGYVDISVTDVIGDVTLDAITAADGDKEVKLTVDTLGTVSLGAISAEGGEVAVDIASAGSVAAAVSVTADTITYAGAELAENKVTMTAGADADITYTGGLYSDTVAISFGSEETDAALDLTFNGDLGTDSLTITANGTNNAITIEGDLGGGTLNFSGAALGTGGNLTIDLSDFSGYDSVTLTAGASASFDFSLGAGADTVVIGQTSAMTVAIDGFDVDGGDKLDVNAVISAINNNATFVAYNAGGAFASENVLLIENEDGTIGDSFFDGISATANDVAYAIVQGANDVLNFYMVTVDANSTSATVSKLADVELTLTGVDLSDLGQANFA